MDPVLTEANQRIQATLDHLKRELSLIRAGRANPTLIEEIPVEAYGTKMKLVELGTISAPQTNLLTVQVWDAAVMNGVLKALQSANLGLNPAAEGQIIRLSIPPLTAERRDEYIKLAHSKMEDVRVSIRQLRHETREEWEKAKTAGEFGEDEFDRRGKLLQELIDKVSEQIDQIGQAKEEELSQI